jgi:tetratricopeptide (TPR) repeat protein
MRKGESSEAIELWQTSAKQQPYTAAAAYYRLGKYYESSLNFASATNRGMGDFPHGTLRPQQNQADWIRALGFFQRAIAADPKNIQYRLHLAQSYYEKQLFYEAIQEWKRALRLKPKNVSIHLQLARVYRRIDVQDRARQHYRQVLELRPEKR